MIRAQGFYWVKYEKRWCVAESIGNGKYWYLPDYIESVADEDLEEINETRLIAPDEQQG